MAGTVEELKTDGIPKLEKQVQEETVKLEQAQDEVEEVSSGHQPTNGTDTEDCRPNPGWLGLRTSFETSET